ncbi:thioredoxin-related transmembrane protein 2 homolog [Rhizophagus clarus]|uniref:Thioredoxin-related transmembrane protein 2 homolog n=1 Tax=Rhizophagus clarus TaxID=94130 RepID=A0A8H3KY69_9GLOM|nr:thioredoxin-related transmembrane protein 2 homolog [Rhizophagus clarus]
MTPLSELYQRLFFPHYIVNFFFCLPYFIIRNVFILKNHLDLSLEPPETKIYLVIGALIILKFRVSASAEEWLSITFSYLKILNIIMFYVFGKTLWAVLYAIAMGVLFVVLPQPRYQGPTKIIELSDQDLFDIKHNKFRKFEEHITSEKVFEVTVAKISMKYTTSEVHFGKIDLDLYPNVAEEYEISLSPTSLDLPALILLKNGKESGRLPKRGKDNEQLDQIKNQKLRNVKETWDRLGWDRSMKSIIETFKLDTLNKTE